MSEPKQLKFLGTSKKDLLSLDKLVQQEIGFQLSEVQFGREPEDWKPMPSVGPNVRELRAWISSGTYRAIYIASFAEAVYVLHCFQKKTERTSKADIELARSRLSLVRLK
jgi:phage-related protein